MSTKVAARSGRTGARLPSAIASDPALIRNVAVVGHSGVGKTTLIEQLLAATGAISRAGSVADGTTVSDADPVEVAQQRSVFLSACPTRHAGVVVNLLDTPGFVDFVGELRAGLRGADAALFVVSAAEDIDQTTLALWEECAALGTPRAVVISRLDVLRADLARTVASCREAFGGIDGNAVLPLYLPAAGGDGLVDLLSMTESEHPQLAADRAALIEAVIAESEDEGLLEAYLDGQALPPATLTADLHDAVGRGQFHPIVPVCAATGLGLAELLGLIVGGFPSPAERPLPQAWTPLGAPGPQLTCDPSGPLAAEVIRTWTDPYLGRLSLVRVFSGTLRSDTPLHVSGHGAAERGHPDHDEDERTANLFDAGLNPIEAAVAGELCVVARLSSAETGDAVSAQSLPLAILPWQLPDPQLPVAVVAATRNDEDGLARALGRLSAADPSLRIDRNADTGQLVLWCLGEAHADVVLSRLRAAAAIEQEPVRVPLLATLTARADGHGRLVKQSGGHGQFAVCDVTVEPLPRGRGVEFADRVVGGAVPANYIGSVEKGVRQLLSQGLRAGVPVTDVRVTLRDGKAHSVDSSDAAFQAAGALAVKDAAAKVDLQLLEPVDRVEITVAEEQIGTVLSDLSGRRARVTGTEPLESGRTGNRCLVRAEIPQLELLRYPIVLRSLTGGAGTFTRRYARHDPAPPAVASAVVSAVVSAPGS